MFCVGPTFGKDGGDDSGEYYLITNLSRGERSREVGEASHGL